MSFVSFVMVCGLAFAISLVVSLALRQMRGPAFWTSSVIASTALAVPVLFVTANLIYESLIRDSLTSVVAAVAASILAFLAVMRMLTNWPGGRARGAIPRPASAPPSPINSPHAPAAATPPVRGPAPDVFISYKREERPQVAALARALEALKLTVWFDAELRSGTSFDAEIDRNVRAARCVLVCWSPGAAQSDWVRAEATIGRQRNVLAAVILIPCDLPAPFNLVHAEDLATGISGAPEAWLRLLDRIGSLTGRPGLADYVRLESAPVAADLALWMARNPGDPLFDLAAARLKASQT